MAFTAPQRADLADALISAFNRGTLDIAVRDLVMGLKAEFCSADTNERLQRSFDAATVESDVGRAARARLLQAVT